MFTGLPLNDSTRALLFDSAQAMCSEKSEYLEIKNKFCEGYVTTAWARGGMGYAQGIIFKAVLETDKGTTEIQYVVRETDIKGSDLQWLEDQPFPEVILN
jgi:hypothetical protein